jgi:hypothetical protein
MGFSPRTCGSIGFVLNAYNQPASRTGAATEGSYAGDIQQALAALEELAQAGKP